MTKWLISYIICWYYLIMIPLFFELIISLIFFSYQNVFCQENILYTQHFFVRFSYLFSFKLIFLATFLYRMCVCVFLLNEIKLIFSSTLLCVYIFSIFDYSFFISTQFRQHCHCSENPTKIHVIIFDVGTIL